MMAHHCQSKKKNNNKNKNKKNDIKNEYKNIENMKKMLFRKKTKNYHAL